MWAVVASIVGGLIVSVGGKLFDHYGMPYVTKTLVPKISETLRRETTIQWFQVGGATIKGLLYGLLAGYMIASLCLVEQVWQTADPREPPPPGTGSPLLDPAIDPGQLEAVAFATGETKMTDAGKRIIVLGGLIGAIIAFVNERRRIKVGHDLLGDLGEGGNSLLNGLTCGFFLITVAFSVPWVWGDDFISRAFVYCRPAFGVLGALIIAASIAWWLENRKKKA